MPDESSSDHIAAANRWLERVGHGASEEAVRRAFEEAFDAVWRRAHVTIGEVTLAAIAQRAVETVAEGLPPLYHLIVDANGVRTKALNGARVPPAVLARGLAQVLVEFLTILGRLTAEILTSALHEELAKLPAVRAISTEESPSSGRPVPGKEGTS